MTITIDMIARAVVTLSRELPVDQHAALIDAAVLFADRHGLHGSLRLLPRFLKEMDAKTGGSLSATVTVSKSAHSAEAEHVFRALKTAMKKQADLAPLRIDPSLMGGARIDVGDERFDYSLRSALDHALQSLALPMTS
ncbi:MAG: F0F1 ATP synthase subunit delta [Candidatus Peregrinibacteria bacterium]